MLKEIKLPKGIYKFNPNDLLGDPGGFGSVYLGKDQSDNECAIKELKIDVPESALRESLIASDLEERNFSHIINILDSGQDIDTDRTYIVMERAKMSLQDYINARKAIDELEVINIIKEIALGLLECSEYVHRDLKPGNVLLDKGSWKISDFGIARSVEKTTSIQTLKEFLTADYAAPEQWNLEHATHATDVYALGCIGYALLTGQPPFSGPEPEDLKKQHLYDKPKTLVGFDPKLITLVNTMLRKPPEVRPSITRIIEMIDSFTDPSIDLHSFTFAP